MRYSPLRHLPSLVWKRRPIQLTFFVTRRCNARCPFCFYLNDTDGAEPRAEEFSLEEVRQTAPSLGRLLWLAFSGGEPYLRRDLVELSRVFYAENRPAIMLYSTNGLLPELVADRTERILAHCRNSTVVVKVSLDGIGEEHDRLRATPGSFERAVRTYHLLARLLNRYPNFELGVNTVLLRGNQDRLDALIEFVRTLPGLRAHTISLVRGDPRDAWCKEVDPAAYRRAAARLEAGLTGGSDPLYRFAGARLKAAQDILQRRLIHDTLTEHKRQIPCYAGRLNLVLNESGELFACEMLSSSLGNLREHGYDARRVLDGVRARAILGGIAEGRCHCTHECYFITNILFNPRLYPALACEYLRLGRAQPGGMAASLLPR
ncbi:MAG: radical SAM protein [Betaproteobacteria bacterium]|nr:radical SAM protein [Betaproteobacteria bacterium]